MSWFIKAITQNYCNFSGRAQRAEYWYFMLFVNIVALGLGFTFGFSGVEPGTFMIIEIILALGIILPSLGVQVRRLHDVGKSGWFWFINFIPLVGFLIVLIWACEDSQPGDNQYGPNPKGIGGTAP